MIHMHSWPDRDHRVSQQASIKKLPLETSRVHIEELARMPLSLHYCDPPSLDLFSALRRAPKAEFWIRSARDARFPQCVAGHLYSCMSASTMHFLCSKIHR